MAYEILKRKNIRSIEGVLFDMDGLVLDTEVLYTTFWKEAANRLNFPMTWEQALGMRSLNKVLGEKYLKSLFGDKINYNEVKALRILLMDGYIEKNGVKAKKGIGELLDFLKFKNIPKAIASSSPQERIKNHLSQVGIYDKFDEICSSYDVKNGKPEPDIYLLAANKIKVPPFKCLALEDSPSGILSAFKAGCLPVVIPDMDEPDENTLKLCFARADSLLDIKELIKEINF